MVPENRTLAKQLMSEIDYIDRKTLELKEEICYRGCPFCDIAEGDFVENHQTKQALFYRFKKCARCSLIYPYPRPKKHIIEGLFVADAFSEKSQKSIDGINEKHEVEKNTGVSHYRILRRMVQSMLPGYAYQEFRKYAKKGFRILDVGAGTGAAAKYLIKKGCVVEAIEPNPVRAEFLRKKVGIKVYESTLANADLEKASYDIVIFSQVLMHLFSLKETLDKVKLVLKNDGLMMSSQMNFNSEIQKTARSPYPGRGLTAFSVVSWFTPESISRILKISGFDVIGITFRPSGIFEYVFVEGYPGGTGSRFVLKILGYITKMILIRTGTSHYFSVIAKKCTKKR